MSISLAPEPSERRGFTWTLSGNVVYSMCQWGFLIVLAKLGTPVDVGVYALGLAITSPILTFANFQGRNMVASDINNKYSFDEYLTFRITSLTVAMAAVLAIALQTQKSWPVIVVTSLLGLSQAFEWTSDTYFGVLQKHDRLDRIAQSLGLKGILSLMLLTAVMYLTHNLVWAVLALAASRGLVLMFFDSAMAVRVAGPARLTWDTRNLWRLLRASFPLGIISAVAALNFNIPRYFIDSRLSTRDLGIFSAIASLVGAGNLVMSALANTSFVAIARASANRDQRRYRALSLRLFGTAAVLGLLGVAVAAISGHKILVTLFRPEYGSSSGVFTRLMLAGAVSYIISGQGYALTAARVLLAQIPILLCATATTTLFCWWLVPVRGIEGAADATLLASIVTLMFSSIILSRVRHDLEPAAVRIPAQESVAARVA